ncbi:hypothetical protein [Chryseobacterium sp.]|uniref:hypothetical protein n=1 Tax=Chryseobacterium sp. TaxID=1871047 RepID=UPI00289A9BDA|nr:hypothetical protein [Chryseobacterium sp.]
MKNLIFIFFIPVFCFGQKDVSGIECTIKSFKTTCLGSSKPISEIQYKVEHSQYGNAKIGRIYGRFEDLNRALSFKNFKENAVEFTCNQKMVELNNPPVYFGQKTGDGRRFYFLHNYSGHEIYRGTEHLNKTKTISLTDPKKYLHLYNREQEKNADFEATFNYYDESGRLNYTFHQRGNEFDEFKYEYENGSLNYSVLKNEILWEEHSSYYISEDGIEEVTITQYNVFESYQFDEKNRVYLKKSKFTSDDKSCNCNEGFYTKIEYWNDNKCLQKVILE